MEQGTAKGNSLGQLGFNTSVFTGTQQKESTGQGLAKVLMTGAKAYEKKQEIDIVYDARQESEYKKQDAMVLNGHYLDQDKRRREFMQSKPSFDEQEMFERTLQTETGELFSTSIQSDHYLSNSSGFISKHDGDINKAFIGGLKHKHKLMYEEIKVSAAANPNITLDELNASIDYLNESSDVTGDIYSVGGTLVGYTKSAITDALASDPLSFDEESWREKYPLLSEIEDPILRKSSNDIARSMQAKKDGIISDKNSSYKNAWYDRIIATNDYKELGMFKKQILEEKSTREHITGGTRKTLLNAIDVLQGKIISSSKSVSKNMKSALNDSIKLFKMTTDLSDSNSFSQNYRNLNNVMTSADSQFVGIVNNIKTLYRDEPQKRDVKLLEVADHYYKNMEMIQDVASHQTGDTIPSHMNEQSKKFLKTHSNKQFDEAIFGSTVNYYSAQKSMNTINKIPDSLMNAIDSSINNEDADGLQRNLYHLQKLSEDKKSYSIIQKNPKASALIELMEMNDSTESKSSMLTMAAKLSDKGERDRLIDNEKEIGFKLRSHSDFKDLSLHSRNLIAKKLAYKSYLSGSSIDDIIDGSAGEEEANKFDTEISDIKLRDPLSVYAEKDIKPFVDMVTKYNDISSDNNPLIDVGRDGSVSIYQGGMLMVYVENKDEIKKIVESDSYYNAEKNTVGNTAGRVFTGLGKSFGTLGGKLKDHILGDKFLEEESLSQFYEGYKSSMPNIGSYGNILIPQMKDK